MDEYNPSGETVTRTFRLGEEWDKILEHEADMQGISVSALLQQIVRRYVCSERFIDQRSTLVINHNAFSSFLVKLSEDEIVESAELFGSIEPEEELLKRGLEFNFESIIWLLDEIYGRYAGWFVVDNYPSKAEIMLHLRHTLNMKWSMYVAGFVSSMFRTLLDIDLKPEIRLDSVTIYIPKKQIK